MNYQEWLDRFYDELREQWLKTDRSKSFLNFTKSIYEER
jgi:hypothetical protein